MNDKDYYLSQVQKLNINGKYGINVKFSDGEGNVTNSMNLNQDSLEGIIDFLTVLQKENKNG